MLQALPGLLHVTRYSAERQTRYSDIVIKKHKDSEIVALAYRLDEMNGMQQYLPCLKMTSNSPAGMPRGDKPKSELEMCMRLTGTLPLSLTWCRITG